MGGPKIFHITLDLKVEPDQVGAVNVVSIKDVERIIVQAFVDEAIVEEVSNFRVTMIYPKKRVRPR